MPSVLQAARPARQSRASRGRIPRSTRSSFSGARILPCSRATCSICSIMVNFIDIVCCLLFVHSRPVYSRNTYDQVHDIVVVQRMPAPVPSLRCRQIGEADIDAVAALLARGFHNRDRAILAARLRAAARGASRRRGCRNMVTCWKATACRSARILVICSMVRADGADGCAALQSVELVRRTRLSAPTRRCWCRRRCATRTSPI